MDMERFINRGEVGERAATPADIRWAQAVNSIDKLNAVLEADDTDIIEVDVSLSGDGEPIAAHPPVSVSDLTIAHLLDRIATTTVGLKLDFKDPLTVEPTLTRLTEMSLSQPVLLNADVLNTSDARRAKVNPDWFVKVCSDRYSRGILSVGWRTSGKDGSVYTEDNVLKMIGLCSEVTAVTHPVRATMLPASWEHIKQLLEIEGRTLTIWNTGPLDDELKAWVKANTDPAKCFYSVDLN
jgi:hypothetical protein